MSVKRICQRCDGSGEPNDWSSGGVCGRCEGSGIDPIQPREDESEGEECENEEPFDAVSEIMGHFISIYGQNQKKAIVSQ